jgi:hypothetical protein
METRKNCASPQTQKASHPIEMKRAFTSYTLAGHLVEWKRNLPYDCHLCFETSKSIQVNDGLLDTCAQGLSPRRRLTALLNIVSSLVWRLQTGFPACHSLVVLLKILAAMKSENLTARMQANLRLPLGMVWAQAAGNASTPSPRALVGTRIRAAGPVPPIASTVPDTLLVIRRAAMSAALTMPPKRADD